MLPTMNRRHYLAAGLLLTLGSLSFYFRENLTVATFSTPSQEHILYPPRPPITFTATPAGDRRLRATLEANERRYQETIKTRTKAIEKAGGRDLPAYTKPTGVDSYILWDFFIPAFSCPFPVSRVGDMGDGGKWVCGLERATHQSSCVIYSMGVDKQSSFEKEVLEQGKDCQVYGFDFSVSDWGPQLRGDAQFSSRTHFYPWKIGAVDNHAANPKEYSLQGIMKELGHDFIDILKIDIEGSEFEALKSVIESFKGQPLPFGQLQIELHIGWSGVNTVGALDDFWTMLEDAGLRPFWTELNLLALMWLGGGPFFAEWSFINIRGKHALIDDSLPEFP
ncbi:methyltransferase domain-containing protein [Roridomyces roridus]|uniref:Methyltransferase domain-containing protein n=1 Tax=Roridomyces roridus TaxID=1738132 RepID=A0AAD7B241_9AGAR|nr:methyltransferase domain-containing protein [Roridomyces roridus]